MSTRLRGTSEGIDTGVAYIKVDSNRSTIFTVTTEGIYTSVISKGRQQQMSTRLAGTSEGIDTGVAYIKVDSNRRQPD